MFTGPLPNSELFCLSGVISQYVHYNKVSGRIFGMKDEISREQRSLHNEKFNNYFLCPVLLTFIVWS
jgi:hypothetical protein